MLSGLMVSFAGSLLASPSVTPPERAGLVRKTGSTATSPGATFAAGPKETSDDVLTVTEAVASGIFGAPAEALMAAVPGARPLTATLMLATPAGKVSVAGVLATAGLLEVSVTG